MVIQFHSYETDSLASGTPPGFSRWYLNFTASNEKSRWLAKKLKDHRLKPGGVRAADGEVVSCEIEEPPAKARWCLELARRFVTRNTIV